MAIRFWKKNDITIRVKLYGGLHQDACINDYNPELGYLCTVSEGARVKTVAKKLQLPNMHSLVYFCNGQRVGVWYKLKDGDELSCFRPSGGG